MDCTSPSLPVVPVEGCSHRRLHVHGTSAAYMICKCRCAACQAAQRVARKRARPQAAVVDTGRVKAHIRRLVAAGWTLRQIAELAGVSHSIVAWLAGTDQMVVSVETARALLGVSLMPSPVGAVRRLQSLMRRGWPLAVVADRLDVPVRCLRRIIASTGSEQQLADWLARQQEAWRTGVLPAGQRRKLAQAGLPPVEGAQVDDGLNEARWRERLDALVEFRDREGRWPSYSGDNLEQQLARWVDSQRWCVRAGQLPVGRCQMLKAAGIDAHRRRNDLADLRWFKTLGLVTGFRAEHGGWPQADGDGDERRLGQWLAWQVKAWQAGDLPAELVQALKKAGVKSLMCPESVDEDWDQQLTALKAFRNTMGHWPSAHVCQIPVELVRGITEVYEDLADTDPAGLGVARRLVAAACQRAVLEGWVPPAAWDDDGIDDPAVPTPVDAVGTDRPLTIQEKAEEAWFLYQAGEAPDDIAHRFGYQDADTFRRVLGRHGLACPWGASVKDGPEEESSWAA